MFIKISRVLIIVICALTLAHCKSVSLGLSGATIEPSEVLGRSWAKELGPTIEPITVVQLTDNAGARPVNLNSPSYLGNTHSILPRMNFGLGSKFQWGTSLAFDDVSDDDLEFQTTYMVTGRYQFLGESREKAKKGNLSGSLFFRLAYGDVDESDDQKESFGPGGFPWTAKAKAYLPMVGLSLGYRLYDPWLIYGAGSYQLVHAVLEVNQGAAGDNSDPGGLYAKTRNGHSMALGVGNQIDISRKFALNLKLMHSHFQMEGLDPQNNFFVGGGFHFHW